MPFRYTAATSMSIPLVCPRSRASFARFVARRVYHDRPAEVENGLAPHPPLGESGENLSRFGAGAPCYHRISNECGLSGDRGGVAGLRAAIELAEAGRVLIIAKDSLRESSSEYAQGGIAVALRRRRRNRQLHERDTLAAGDGLCERAAVHAPRRGGAAAIRQLTNGGPRLIARARAGPSTREGAHSPQPRAARGRGDSTGHEIALHPVP